MFSSKKRLLRIDEYVYEVSHDDYFDILKLFTILSSNEEGSVNYYNAHTALSRYKKSLDASSKRPKYILDLDLTEIF